MASIYIKAAEIGWLDRLASRNTPLARIDPRVKLITTLAFIVTVLSYGKYEIVALLPLVVYPLALMNMGDVPSRFLFRKLLIASPFAIFVGLFNPLLDRQPVLILGSYSIAGGWVSYAAILLRFVLTVSAALAMMAGTGIYNVCRGMERLGVPSVFTVQVLLLYRYLFVLMDEGLRMVRARALRSVGDRGMGYRVYGSMLGSLLLRTLDRAQRVHVAMCCRGFDGHVRTMDTLRLHGRDVLFLIGWLGLFAVLRLSDVAGMLGTFLMGAHW